MKRKLFGKNWFFENFLEDETDGGLWAFKINKEVFSGKSKFQKIEIFDTDVFGRVLTLDGLVQFGTKSEFTYHEMLVHPAMFYHSKPEKVLIIGGGDGLALREVLKHPVKEVFLVDIDKEVTNVCKKYFKSNLKGSLDDKRVTIFNEDALNFVKKFKNEFEVIIKDLTGPTPVAKFCWNKKFYKDIFSALKKDGVIGVQTGLLGESFAIKTRKELSEVFSFFRIHKTFVISFPFDEHTFSFGSKKINLNKVSFITIKKRVDKSKIDLKYYSPEIHFASAVLPKNFKQN